MGAGRASASLAHGTPDRAPNARQAAASLQGKWSTVGGLMGFLFGRGFFVEGLFAHIMYRSLRVMHEAVGGTLQALLGIFVHALANRAGPRVKLLC